MSIPVVLVFAVLSAREQRRAAGSGSRRGILRGLPLFIVWFLVASALNTLGAFRILGTQTLPALGQFLIVVALADVGLSADLRAMVRTGFRPILLGLLGWIALASISLLLQHLTAGL
ncbi:MAG: putative sulfate exporter family transporter [Ktedonobacterales bacterium]